MPYIPICQKALCLPKFVFWKKKSLHACIQRVQYSEGNLYHIIFNDLFLEKSCAFFHFNHILCTNWKNKLFYCLPGPIFLKNQQNQTLHTVFAQMGGLLLQMLLSCKLYFSKVADFCNFLPTYFPLHPLRKPRVKHLSKRGKM